jgi:sodium-dependent dicarboxylate transporter 2/3/5
MSQLTIVLLITVFMIISFFVHKVPFGLTTMTCCALLFFTGIFDLPTAFGGLCNKNVILVAGMFVMSAAFGKTSLLQKIRQNISRMESKRGIVLLLIFYGLAIIFAQFLPTTANMTIMIMFLMSLSDTGDITPSRMLLPVLGIISVWGTKLPIGMGATSFASLNARYEGLGASPDQLLGVFDRFKVSIIPCLLMLLYCMFAYRLMPNRPIAQENLKKTKEQEAIPKRNETIIYIVFALVMLSLFFNNVLGDYMYGIPILGTLVLAWTGAMSTKDIVKAIASDSTWMLAGVLVMADAMGQTGAGDAIGNLIIHILGGNPSGIAVLAVFAIATVLMTTFMSNSATGNILIPIAASTAIAGGMDPRGVVLIVSCCSGFAIAFPSGSPACGIAFATGQYKIGETLKFTIPFLIIGMVSIVLCANFFFPVYG